MNVKIFHGVNALLKLFMDRFTMLVLLMLIVVMNHFDDIKSAIIIVQVYVAITLIIILLVLILTVLCKDDLQAAINDARIKELDAWTHRLVSAGIVEKIKKEN